MQVGSCQANGPEEDASGWIGVKKYTWEDDPTQRYLLSDKEDLLGIIKKITGTLFGVEMGVCSDGHVLFLLFFRRRRVQFAATRKDWEDDLQ